MTCVTAIASPNARPSPRMRAATTPPFTDGMTTPFTISQRVAPSASEPSSRSLGTPMKSSRQIAELIGMIMIVSTSIAGKTPDGLAGPLKRGSHPSTSIRNGSMCCDTKGAITKIPQRPMTTLGTAASISISVPIGPRTAGGASSDRKRPIAIDSGAASRIAPNDVTSVPTMNCAAPNSLRTGFQLVDQMNSMP
jgi:hypothetical protein